MLLESVSYTHLDVYKRQDLGVLKPWPEIFNFALSATQSELRESLMIGDSWEADITGAHGIGTVSYTHLLRNLYLNPIREQFEMNGGSGYPNGKSFQLLIDLKTDYKETMKAVSYTHLELANQSLFANQLFPDCGCKGSDFYLICKRFVEKSSNYFSFLLLVS